jgi:hypothetical protein
VTGTRRKDPEQERKEREAERREFKSIFKSVMELGESCCTYGHAHDQFD